MRYNPYLSILSMNVIIKHQNTSDIRSNIKFIIGQLEKGSIEIKPFNGCVGDIFFHMMAIKFREEYSLFPVILCNQQ